MEYGRVRSRVQGAAECAAQLRADRLLLAVWLGEADTELLESARHIEVLVKDGEDDYSGTWGLLFDGGGNARMNGITFEEGRTKPWKEGWITADIKLGMGTAK